MMTTVTHAASISPGRTNHQSSDLRVEVKASLASRLAEIPQCWAFGDVSVQDPTARMEAQRKGLNLAQRARAIWTVARGNLVMVDADSKEALVAAHPSGAFSTFYSTSDALLVLGGRIQDVTASLADSEPDWAGVASVLRSGYCLNGRTVNTSVRRLQPGQALHVTSIGSALRVREVELSRIWAVEPDKDPPSEDLVETLWHRLSTASERGRAGIERQAVMMSGGWDSRTLLASLATPGNGTSLVCYAHGDTESREIGLVRQLSEIAGTHSLCREIDLSVYAADRLQSMFGEVGETFFPHWYASGKALSESGYQVAYCGVLGEVVGGHYGISMSSGGWEKALAVAAYSLGMRSLMRRANRQGIAQSTLATSARPSRPWFIAEEAWSSLQRGYAELHEDAASTVRRLRERGVATEERLVEAAISELRGGQLICSQPRSLQPNLPVSLPFADNDLLELAASIPMRHRIHNSLNRQMLLRKARRLTTLPTAAALVPASAPIMLQEASRLARHLAGQRRDRIYRRLGFRYPARPRFSWVGFEPLRNGALLNGLVASLRSEIWDRPAMQQAIATARTAAGPASMHPLTDVMSRIVSVDMGLARD